jgi:hypothetical protein
MHTTSDTVRPSTILQYRCSEIHCVCAATPDADHLLCGLPAHMTGMHVHVCVGMHVCMYTATPGADHLRCGLAARMTHI